MVVINKYYKECYGPNAALKLPAAAVTSRGIRVFYFLLTANGSRHCARVLGQGPVSTLVP